MRSWITRWRARHGRPACWCRLTLLVGLGLGGLAGCAPFTDEPRQAFDGVRQEVSQLRAETEQLRAVLRELDDGLQFRDAALVQLGERLQALEKDVPILAQPSGPRAPLPAMDVLPAISRLTERLSAVERRLATLEGTPPKPPGRPPPAGASGGHPGGRRLQVEMSPDEVRALLGAPVTVEDTSAGLFWYYGLEQFVVFSRDTGRVQGWIGVAP